MAWRLRRRHAVHVWSCALFNLFRQMDECKRVWSRRRIGSEIAEAGIALDTSQTALTHPCGLATLQQLHLRFFGKLQNLQLTTSH